MKATESHRKLLIISIVTFAPNLPVLEQTLSSLNHAISYAKRHDRLGCACLYVIDNGPGEVWQSSLQDLLAKPGLLGSVDTVDLRGEHGNIGYGAGHNLAIRENVGHFHLILNPDVVLEEDALAQALSFMADHPQAGLLAPAVADGEDNLQYLCKRYPSVLDLLLRGFAPDFLRNSFQSRLNRYELRDQIGLGRVVWDVPLVSGCFMLLRRSALEQVQGFALDYFMYFEDFDLSLRVGQVARTVYVPSVQITHFGGQAAQKGWRHIGMFLRSLVTFFNRHGWRWW